MTERLYEGLFLIDAAIAASEWTEIEGQIRTLLQNNGADIQYAEKWPEQRLAYPVKGVKRGVYFLAYFNASSGSIASIRSDGQLNEKILRMLIIQEDFLPIEMEKRREAAERAAAAPPPPTPAAKDASESSDAPAESAEAPVEESADAGETAEAAGDETPSTETQSSAGESAVEESAEVAEESAEVTEESAEVTEESAEVAEETAAEVEEVVSKEEETN